MRKLIIKIKNKLNRIEIKFQTINFKEYYKDLLIFYRKRKYVIFLLWFIYLFKSNELNVWVDYGIRFLGKQIVIRYYL